LIEGFARNPSGSTASIDHQARDFNRLFAVAWIPEHAANGE